jgi:hypothetical protein
MYRPGGSRRVGRTASPWPGARTGDADRAAGVDGAISGAARALDALYRQLVTPEIKVAGPRDDKAREAHIRECLKRRFDTGKRDLEWVSHFQRLFNLRDAAVHAEVKPLPAVPHPSGVSNAGQVNADYSAEEAVNAVDLSLDVLNTCVQIQKPSDDGAKAWAVGY